MITETSLKSWLNTNNHILCADIGSSSLKMSLISEDGFVLNSISSHFTKIPGKDLAEIWLENFVLAAKKLLSHPQAKLAAICISGNGPTLVAYNQTTNKTFTYMWNEKPKTDISKILKDNKIKSIFLPRILQLKTDYPEIFDSASIISSGPEYLAAKISCTESGLSLPRTILPEQRFISAYWDSQILKELKINKEKLPPLVSFGFSPQVLDIDIGQNPSSIIPVFCGGPDFVTALIGSGTLEEGRILDRSGSSEGINLCTESPNLIDTDNINKLRILPSVLPDLWNKSVLIPDSGIRFSQWKKTSQWKDASYTECVSALIDKNFTSQEKTEGLKIMNSILVDVKNAYTSILKEKKFDEEIPTVICTGGQAKNPIWMQLKADTLGIPLSITNCQDTELMGCAILASTALGNYESLSEAAKSMVKIEKTFTPST